MAENEDMALARIYSDLGVTPSQIQDELMSARLRELQDQELTRYERAVQPGVRGARDFLYRTAGFRGAPLPDIRGIQSGLTARQKSRFDAAEARRDALLGRLEDLPDPTTTGTYKAQEQAASLAKDMADEAYKRATYEASQLTTAYSAQQKRQLEELDRFNETLDKLKGIATGTKNAGKPLDVRVEDLALKTVGQLGKGVISSGLNNKDVANIIRTGGNPLRTVEELTAFRNKLRETARKFQHEIFDENGELLNFDDIEAGPSKDSIEMAQFYGQLEILIQAAEKDENLISDLGIDNTLSPADEQLVIKYGLNRDTGEIDPNNLSYSALIDRRNQVANKLAISTPKFAEATQEFLRERTGNSNFVGTIDEAAREIAMGNIPAFEIQQQQNLMTERTRLYQELAKNPGAAGQFTDTPQFQTYARDNGFVNKTTGVIDNVNALRALAVQSAARDYGTKQGEQRLNQVTRETIQGMTGRGGTGANVSSGAGTPGGTRSSMFLGQTGSRVTPMSPDPQATIAKEDE
tara:strand:- start:20734 stop:22299 length:1566 start_codon:yes stop_codon:yes gene_type:complete